MSAEGQKLPKEAFLGMSALPPLATELRTSREVRFVPQAEMHPSALFNNGGRAYNQPGGHLNSQLFGRLEIDDKFKPHWLRVRYVARIGSAEYLDDLRYLPANVCLDVRSIGHQSACFRKITVRVNGGKPHLPGQLNQQGPVSYTHLTLPTILRV